MGGQCELCHQVAFATVVSVPMHKLLLTDGRQVCRLQACLVAMVITAGIFVGVGISYAASSHDKRMSLLHAPYVCFPIGVVAVGLPSAVCRNVLLARMQMFFGRILDSAVAVGGLYVVCCILVVSIVMMAGSA